MNEHVDEPTNSWPTIQFNAGQNAIATLFQPPIVYTRRQPYLSAPTSSLHQAPTSRDIPPVTLTNIKSVDTAEFELYISQIGPLYEQLQRAKDSKDEAQTRPGSKANKPLNGFKDSLEAASITAQNERRKSRYGPHPLSIIPNIYFVENFHLENPRIFDVVSERSDVVPPTATKKASNGDAPVPRKALAANAILQEKLSWYMEIVEVQLINSISLVSATLFTTLESLRELLWEATNFVEKIQTLRKDLKSLDEDVSMRGLKILQDRQKEGNLQQLLNAVLQLKWIVNGIASCESLVDEEEAETALAKIATIELLIAGESDEILGEKISPRIQLRDMRGATALKGVMRDLTILRFRIGKIFDFKVHNLLIGDLRRHVQTVSTPEVLLRWESASLRAKGDQAREVLAFPAYMSVTDELRDALLLNISGLCRSGSLSTAIQAYRELVLREIRNIVRKPLPSSSDDGESVILGSTLIENRGRTKNHEKSSILAQNLRALDAEDAEALFSTIYIGVAETLRRLKTQAGLLLDIAYAVGSIDVGDPVKSPIGQSSIRNSNPVGNASIQEDMHNALGLPELLGQAVDASLERINKILLVRSEQVRDLSLAHFLRYFTLNLLFANECEAISGQAGTSFKTVVDGHIKDFIKAHRDREIQTLAQGTGADNWQDKDFTAKDNEILKQILECSVSDPPMWIEMSKIWAPPSQSEVEEIDDLKVFESSRTAKSQVRGAYIKEEIFLLPDSAILCLRGISHFLNLIGSIPSMTPDITMSLISYLQTFDSRCRQLVLGAGAMRSASLKNITTKHLALTSRALSFIAAIIPHIRAFIGRHAPAGPTSANFIGEFSKVQHAFEEHQDSIYQKMVEIMESRARMLSRKALETEWDKENPENVRGYMADLTMDTGKLYKVVSKYLPAQVVELVMDPVFASYRDHLGKALREADPKTDTGRDCMLRDAEYLIAKLGKANGFGDLGTYLIKIIKDKKFKIILPMDSPPSPIMVAKEELKNNNINKYF